MGVIGVDSQERIHAAGIVETNFPNGNREQDLKGLARWVVHMPALGNIQRITKRGVRDSVGQICVRSVLARIAGIVEFHSHCCVLVGYGCTAECAISACQIVKGDDERGARQTGRVDSARTEGKTN